MRKKYFILGILFVLFCIVLLMVSFSQSEFLDQAVYSFIISFRCSALDQYFTIITKFANTTTIVVVVFAFLLIFRNRYGITLGSSACVCVLTNQLLKRIVRRVRPSGLRLISQGGYSFPSGHAMISVCVYGYLLYLVITKIKNRYLKYSLATFLVVFILSIGASRIYVGVHYFTDILAGYLLASMELLLVVDWSKKLYSRR